MVKVAMIDAYPYVGLAYPSMHVIYESHAYPRHAEGTLIIWKNIQSGNKFFFEFSTHISMMWIDTFISQSERLKLASGRLNAFFKFNSSTIA